MRYDLRTGRQFNQFRSGFVDIRQAAVIPGSPGPVTVRPVSVPGFLNSRFGAMCLVYDTLYETGDTIQYIRRLALDAFPDVPENIFNGIPSRRPRFRKSIPDIVDNPL